MIRLCAAISLALVATPLAARESLGVFERWAAFSDARPQRCYAIAKAQGSAPAPAYATVSHWPKQRVRGAVHLVLSRSAATAAPVRLTIGDKRFELVAKGRNAWARGPREDSAIVAALRSAKRMSVSAKSEKGASFTDRYALAGAATAMDAATVGCARRG